MDCCTVRTAKTFSDVGDRGKECSPSLCLGRSVGDSVRLG